MYKKTIARLEKNFQMSRIKLSVAHTENMDYRNQIDAMRRDKVLFLQIQSDLVSHSLSLSLSLQHSLIDISLSLCLFLGIRVSECEG